MRLTFTFLMVIFIFNSNKLHAQTIVEKYGIQDTFPHDSKVEITNEIRMWFDSLHYRFQIVTFSGIPLNNESLAEDNFLRQIYYSSFDGPIILRDEKNCTIYPMFYRNVYIDTLNKIKSMEAIFCMEDLQLLSDSITVLCEGYSGYINRSQMDRMVVKKELIKNKDWFLYDEDKTYPVATEEWYRKWDAAFKAPLVDRIWFHSKRYYCD